jgi:branched-chain amino acid transport system ATP-binding protein
MQATQPLLRAAGLHTFYGASHVLRGVSLQIEYGQSVGLLGRNGMGKTTLIRTLVGHLKPTDGHIEIRGVDCTAGPPERNIRMGIAYVPEGRGIFPNLTVLENLKMAARKGVSGSHTWTFERVVETFPRLSERLANWGQQLSGGEQQMLAIGRALMTNPDLLILDEATEGLAPLVVKDIWRTIREIRASGISTLIVDRDYRSVLAHTDRCVILEKGVIAVNSTSSALRSDTALMEKLLGV